MLQRCKRTRAPFRWPDLFAELQAEVRRHMAASTLVLLSLTCRAERNNKDPVWFTRLLAKEKDWAMLSLALRYASADRIHNVTWWDGDARRWWVRELLRRAKDPGTHWCDRSCRECLQYVGWAALQVFEKNPLTGEDHDTPANRVILRHVFALWPDASDYLDGYWKAYHFAPYDNNWTRLNKRGLFSTR